MKLKFLVNILLLLFLCNFCEARDVVSSLDTIKTWAVKIFPIIAIIGIILNSIYSHFNPEGARERLVSCIGITIFGILAPSIVSTLESWIGA